MKICTGKSTQILISWSIFPLQHKRGSNLVQFVMFSCVYSFVGDGLIWLSKRSCNRSTPFFRSNLVWKYSKVWNSPSEYIPWFTHSWLQNLSSSPIKSGHSQRNVDINDVICKTQTKPYHSNMMKSKCSTHKNMEE